MLKKNSATVEYTFEVINLDSENISVLDPDKIESKYFHYLTNGVSFTKGNNHYSSDSQSESHSGGILKEWFETLKPGESIIRSVELTGFAELPSGLVKCRFSFPGHHPKNVSWKNSNGRYWLGDYRITKELILE